MPSSPNAAESFAGAMVVITGAAGGIGTALCGAFLAEGAKVQALDVDAAGLDRLAADEPDAIPYLVDITDPSAVGDVFEALGPVDVLINNAGVTALGPFADIPFEAVERVMTVNLLGAFACTRAALPGLLERKGRIGVMSSVAGFAPLVDRTAYAASKHALHGMFESLRAELAGTGVSVTIVCPSFAGTGIEHRAVARAEGAKGEWSTTGRVLTADDVAAATVEGVRSRSRLVLPSTTARLAHLMWRMAPATYERTMRRRIRGS